MRVVHSVLLAEAFDAAWHLRLKLKSLRHAMSYETIGNYKL
jgi:hypothetical protein